MRGANLRCEYNRLRASPKLPDFLAEMAEKRAVATKFLSACQPVKETPLQHNQLIIKQITQNLILLP